MLTVVPRGVCPRRHYGYAAIALALVLWRVVGQSVGEVRRHVCAWPVTTTRTSVWPALRRWCAALGDRFAQQAMGRAPPRLSCREPGALAFAGGSAMP